ncbi:haloacid dehalogenase I [Pseudomonas sp. MT-1]|uniref:haloacid dehalogenase type II n=1 Tax=Stutzerimonas stutzeri TaxID=316 RepID=UPI000535E2B9|nr:haloacid dehalogenase type II [Stutzerimonas stutzeri]MCQ4283948.1 haloacid dehalogenase type II [Stutzerimonas stutzeri]BAP79897.1 haloacid dehalogenase I [Pseudomonas sp. MT-1]
MLRHLVFDVNETLLDVAALDPLFERLFGDASARVEWFLTLEEGWMTATIVERFQPFANLAQAALVMVGQRRGIEVSEAQCQELVEGMKRLPAHPDVRPALEQLRGAGFQLAALSNGSLPALRQQLESAGLGDSFDAILSVEETQRYKPAPEPYRMVAERNGIAQEQMMMVAAHAWDITGAAAVGCRTAFIARPGKVLNPAGSQPDIHGNDLQDFARQLLAWRER